MTSPLSIIILAAGKGTRMRSDLPKVLHKVAGQSMLSHVIRTAKALNPSHIVVVTGHGREMVEAEVAAIDPAIACVTQAQQRGTAHAVLCAHPALTTPDEGQLLVLYGDTPLITPAHIQPALEGLKDHTVIVLGMRPDNPAGYGRLVTGGDVLAAIVEEKDATKEQKALGLCNSGIMALQASSAWTLLERIGNNNKSNEYYLTDIVAEANATSLSCSYIEAGEGEACVQLLGVNSRAELAIAETAMQWRLRLAAMEAGVTMIAPETIFLQADTTIGTDVTIHPHVIFGTGVTIEHNAEIKSFCHLEQCHVGAQATIGPFARLRPGAVLAKGAHIGNFVEIKNAEIGIGAKINHLSYVGDASVGQAANLGAGTITCNYDGFTKSRTQIGAHAFIGSNTALVAPINVGDGAIVGAGSTITEDVPADAMAFTRPLQTTLPGKGKAYRDNRGSQKQRLS